MKKFILSFIIVFETIVIGILLFQNISIKKNSSDVLNAGDPIKFDNSGSEANKENTESAYDKSEGKSDKSKDTQEIIEEENDAGTIKEKIIIHDNGTQTVEYPYIDAPLNSYDFSNLTTDEKKKKMYYENNEPAAKFGIDISQYQGNIDWNKVKNEGVEFAILRAGYRGYETGILKTDSKFIEYAQGAGSVDIGIGVYFYSQAINETEAAEEADYVLNLLNENNISPDYPIVFDWEFVLDEDPARTDLLDKEMINKCCITFCEKIKAAGYMPMYYTNITNALFKFNMPQLSGYGMWLAEYSKSTDFIYNFDMWQYTCSGLIDGIDSLVDLNLYFTKKSED